MLKHLNKFFFILSFILFSIAVVAQEKSLAAYIDSGLMKSPLLKEYSNMILANGIDSMRISASYKPQVNGSSYNNYSPVINGYGFDNVITNGANFSQLVTVSKQLVSKQNLQNQFNGIQLQSNSLSITSKISEQDLKRTITSQYITAYGKWQQYSFNKEVYDLLSKEDTVLKKLTQAGVYRQTDYLTFLVTLQQQQLAITQAKIEFQNEFATLNYVSGMFDTSFSTMHDPGIKLNDLPELESTVFYQKFNTDSLLLKNKDAQIDFAYKPKVSLYANGGYVSTFSYLPYKNFGAGVGLNVDLPIYDGRQKKMQHEKIAIEEQTREDYRDFFKTQYRQQVAQLVQQLQSTQEFINETTEQLKYTEALLQANGKLMATGDVHIADYVIAINNYLNAKNIIAQNTINKLQIISQINYWNKQ